MVEINMMNGVHNTIGFPPDICESAVASFLGFFAGEGIYTNSVSIVNTVAPRSYGRE